MTHLNNLMFFSRPVNKLLDFCSDLRLHLSIRLLEVVDVLSLWPATITPLYGSTTDSKGP